ncbi:hypothetical protein OAO01_05390 [Oligoflexia bacterium]|nr:hypothetical protein [Oligoflexia bacterium]
MKTIILAPFGGLSQEAGIMYLLANYMLLFNSDTLQLTCNGIFSLCDRDRANSWRRNISSCLQCMSDQRNLAAWGGLHEDALSTYLRPEEVEKTKRWILTLAASELLTADYDGFALYELWQGSFHRRFGEQKPNLQNKHHENFIRRLMLSTLRMLHASKRFIDEQLPAVSFVAGGEDFITRSYIQQAKIKSSNIVKFSWDPGSRYVKILRAHDQSVFPCEVLLDSITSMRADVKTWPEELVAILDEILDFLGMSESQLQLPMAQGSI